MPALVNSSVDGSEGTGDYLRINVSQPGSVTANLGPDPDVVEVVGNSSVQQVRLSFTSAQVGNGNALDSNSMANQDGGLAVRLQAEDASGNLTGPVSRLDDEGISFISNGAIRFDVRDLVSGVQRGDQFQVVRLGTSATDFFSEGQSTRNTYINAGMGDDAVSTGFGNDFLVGGGGNDRLAGNQGDDSFIGGAGNDIIVGGAGDDTAIFNISTDGADTVALGGGNDRVTVSAAAGVTQVRLTFTSAEVGNNNINDGRTLANQDGGYAVRMQAEDGSDALVGPISRYDDELITFVATGDLTFDVRDLVSGTARGDQFKVATLGSGGTDVIDFTGRAVTYYVNGGGGNDIIAGGTVSDFLVGGVGNDRIDGKEGNDSFIGGAGADRFVFTANPGNDRILDFVSGADKIDLSFFDLVPANVTSAASGSNTILSVDVNNDTIADFTITLVNAGPPASGDYIL
jgi:Ca2+-binding RTX toxin-like protein